MNKGLLNIIVWGVFGTGALIFSGCGPEDIAQSVDNNELSLDSASDNYLIYNGAYSEYGRCNDTLDNDGDGFADMADPDCHINFGPMRDLSLYDFPIGHNFNPDITKIPPYGPGYAGGFRDRAQITRWFRFLTEPDGYVSETQVMGPGVNNDVVPVPQPLWPKAMQGTFAQGNNNNLFARDLHEWFLDHRFLGAEPVLASPEPVTSCEEGIATDNSACSGNVIRAVSGTASEYLPNYAPISPSREGLRSGWPYKHGSQGYLQREKKGNHDQSHENND